MENELYKQYAEVKAKINALTEQEDFLKAGILAELDKLNMRKIENAYGKFTVASRKNYTYSPFIKNLEEEVKIKKVEEQEKGIAEVKETKYITYSPIK